MADWKLLPGDWCHIDVLSGDSGRAQAFYQAVFGWTVEPYAEADYRNVKTSRNGIESGIGGLAQATAKAPPASSGVVPYILAPNLDEALAKIEQAGGTVVIPRTDVFGYGEFAHFRDPDGNVIGLWRDSPAEHGS